MLGHQAAYNRVAGLVVGCVSFLFVRHHHRAALGAHHDFVAGFFKFFHRHHAAVATRGKQRRLVDQVGKIGT